MGRTIPSAAMKYQQFAAQIQRWKRSLSRGDQKVVDDLFILGGLHVAECAYAAHPLPEQMFILAMILEEHKRIMEIREQVEPHGAEDAGSDATRPAPGSGR